MSFISLAFLVSFSGFFLPVLSPLFAGTLEISPPLSRKQRYPSSLSILCNFLTLSDIVEDSLQQVFHSAYALLLKDAVGLGAGVGVGVAEGPPPNQPLGFGVGVAAGVGGVVSFFSMSFFMPLHPLIKNANTADKINTFFIFTLHPFL
jgi:hypothetical protein